jgi:hypothetical protein
MTARCIQCRLAKVIERVEADEGPVFRIPLTALKIMVSDRMAPWYAPINPVKIFLMP